MFDFKVNKIFFEDLYWMRLNYKFVELYLLVRSMGIIIIKVVIVLIFMSECLFYFFWILGLCIIGVVNFNYIYFLFWL